MQSAAPQKFPALTCPVATPKNLTNSIDPAQGATEQADESP
jgi:hypothetical protein